MRVGVRCLGLSHLGKKGGRPLAEGNADPPALDRAIVVAGSGCIRGCGASCLPPFLSLRKLTPGYAEKVLLIATTAFPTLA